MHPIIKRLLNYFFPALGNTSGSPDAPSITPVYERSFDRFSLASEVLVDSVDALGKEFTETSALRDVSGSGAMFITHTPEAYFKGQQLKLNIFLAGTNTLRACVKTEAEVVRIQSLGLNNDCNDCERMPGREGGKTGVAVKFSLPFEFQRMENAG
jgi:hypothetical protein